MITKAFQFMFSAFTKGKEAPKIDNQKVYFEILEEKIDNISAHVDSIEFGRKVGILAEECRRQDVPFDAHELNKLESGDDLFSFMIRTMFLNKKVFRMMTDDPKLFFDRDMLDIYCEHCWREEDFPFLKDAVAENLLKFFDMDKISAFIYKNEMYTTSNRQTFAGSVLDIDERAIHECSHYGNMIEIDSTVIHDAAFHQRFWALEAINDLITRDYSSDQILFDTERVRRVSNSYSRDGLRKWLSELRLEFARGTKSNRERLAGFLESQQVIYVSEHPRLKIKNMSDEKTTIEGGDDVQKLVGAIASIALGE